MLVTVGAPGDATTNDSLLVAMPFGELTPIGPVVAPLGTVVVNSVVVAAVTVAFVPLNVTVFDEGVVLNPVPWIVTVVVSAPEVGVNPMIDTWDEVYRSIERRFPTAS